ncbi:hypothetical protein B0H34DRAFT_800434 [Crassisporium funariophilum]|nr:hypothetical protein B0H34DRAFT_800434 [Crassisporium funariophilum]
MSGLSPARRLRTKTSDLTDFFRGAGHSNQARQVQKDTTAPVQSMNLEVPSSSELEGDGVAQTKKKITRIPLFGRSRKKSNQSTASSPFASTSLVRDSSDIGEAPSRTTSTDRRPPTAPESSTSKPQPPPLPTSAKASSQSIGSKFFGHSRASKRLTVSQFEPEPQTPSSTLSPPSTRTGSYESNSSNGTRPRSTTPRSAKPLITVSLSPDNLDQYKDLFTQPSSANGSSTSQITVTRQSGVPEDSDMTPNSSPPPSLRTRSPEQPVYPRRGYTPASAIAAAHRQTTCVADERPPSTSSRSSKKNTDSSTSTPRSSDTKEPSRPTVVEREKERIYTPSEQRRPSAVTGSNQPPETVMRSRMKLPSSPRSRPPSMPLPLPPASNPPTSSPPDVPASPSYQSETLGQSIASGQKALIRPRAHTIGAVTNPSTLTPLSRPITLNKVVPTPGDATPATRESFDIDTASVERLRQALRTRDLQYDELATYVLKMTEAHVTEVSALEKKISALDREAARREKEVKGLRWIISNGESSQPQPLPPGILNHARLSPTTSTTVDSDTDAVRNSRRRLYYQSDSGAESYAHSGAESLRASGASGTESISSIIRTKKFRRPYTLAENTYNVIKSTSTRRSTKVPPGLGGENVPDVPYLSATKRSSMSSMSPSPSSSQSSLLPPSPSITMSSLSAIPEGPTSTLRLPRFDSSEQQEERRATRASHRTSTSSMTSSSTAASSAYSANMKRSRPPSIAQVLEKSPIMDDVLDKLRPFA